MACVYKLRLVSWGEKSGALSWSNQITRSLEEIKMLAHYEYCRLSAQQHSPASPINSDVSDDGGIVKIFVHIPGRCGRGGVRYAT